ANPCCLVACGNSSLPDWRNWHSTRFLLNRGNLQRAITTGDEIMLTRSIGMAVVTLLGITFAAGTASAHGFGRIDELGVTLQGQTRALQGEFAEHFRSTPHFRHLMSDAREMAGLA